MPWIVDFYDQSVYDVLMEWPDKIKQRFLRLVELLEKHGHDLGMPYTCELGEGLFELRAKGMEGIGRAFFCYAANKRVIILHGFIKKTPKTPLKELRLARAKLKEVRKYGL